MKWSLVEKISQLLFGRNNTGGGYGGSLGVLLAAKGG